MIRWKCIIALLSLPEAVLYHCLTLVYLGGEPRVQISPTITVCLDSEYYV